MPSPRKTKTVSAVKRSQPLVCADALADKKAEDITILDMRGLSSFTDYFVICSGASEPQLKAIANSVREAMKEKFNAKPVYEDGFPASQWVILDYSDVLIHIFHKDKRDYYGLENLWSDAERIEYPDAPEKPAKVAKPAKPVTKLKAAAKKPAKAKSKTAKK